MLQALVHNQTPDPDKPAFDDFIEGKGKGLIVLLQCVISLKFAAAHCLLLQWSARSRKDIDGRSGFRISETTALSSLSQMKATTSRRSLTLHRSVPAISVSTLKSSKTVLRRFSTSSLAGRPSYCSTRQMSSSKLAPSTTCSITHLSPSSCGN